MILALGTLLLGRSRLYEGGPDVSAEEGRVLLSESSSDTAEILQTLWLLQLRQYMTYIERKLTDTYRSKCS